MNNFETPHEFDLSKKIGNDVFSYSELMEVVQGGPEIGFLNKNGQQISKLKFGGPFIYNAEYIYIPLFVKNIFKSGFKLVRINVNTLEIKEFGSIKGVIFLDK